MKSHVSEVIVEHHRRLLALFDAVEARKRGRSLAALERALALHFAVEEELVYPHLAITELALRHGADEHALLRFAIERAREPVPELLSAQRLRLARDLFVVHVEHEERVTLPALEQQLGHAQSRRVAGRCRSRLRRRSTR